MQSSIFQYVPSSYIETAELVADGAGDCGTAGAGCGGLAVDSRTVGVSWAVFALHIPLPVLPLAGVAITRTGAGADGLTSVLPLCGSPGKKAPWITAS